MSRFKNLVPHKVVADVFQYKYVIAGRPKAGKTSLVHGIVKEKYDGDLSKLLLVAFEKGYNALNGIYAEDINEWSQFEDLVEDLVAEKDEISFKILALDTVDEMAKMATKHVLATQSRKDAKKYTAINDLAYGKGYELLDNTISEQLKKLDQAGFSIIYLTHDKDKQFETREGLKYDKTTLSLSGRVRDLVLNQVDFIVFIELTKELEKGKMVDKRHIYFRGDSGLEAGSRFRHVPNRIEYSFKGFVDTVEEAILKEYDGDEDAVEVAKKEQQTKRDKDAKVFVEKASQDIDSLKEKVTEIVTDMSKSDKLSFSKYLKAEFGDNNYMEFEEVNDLAKIVDYLQNQ